MSNERRWTRIGIDAVVIVASILLAFGIDAWWEGRGERRTEREALSALARDFAGAETILAERLVTIDSAAVAAQAIIDLVGPGADAHLADSLGTLIPRIIRRPTFQPPMGTLEGLLGSGELRLIRNPELKAALASFPSELADMRETQGFGSEVVFGMLLPYLNERVPMLEFGLMARGESDFTGEVLDVLQSLEFENLAQNRLMGIRFEILGARELGERISAVRQLLRDELER